MITFLIIALVLFLIAVTPLGGTFIYRDGAVCVKARIAGIPFIVYPKKRKVKKTEKPKKETSEKKQKEPKESKNIKEWIVFARDMLLLLKRRLPPLWRSFAITKFYAVVVIASTDAAQTADLYGKTCAVASALYPIYMEALHIKKHDVTIDVDFNFDKPRIEAEITARITFGALLIFALTAGYGALKGYLKLNNSNNKDKAVHTSE